MPVITFLPQNKRITVDAGANLRASAIKEYISIYPHIFKILNCRGNGLCGTCVVEIVAGATPPPGADEAAKLGKKAQANPKLRLGCKVVVNNDIVVRTHV